MNQHPLQDIGSTSQMGSPQSPGFVQMGKGTIQPFPSQGAAPCLASPAPMGSVDLSLHGG